LNANFDMKREFPDHPIVGVGGVVIRGQEVLLIRRGTAPLKGRWTIPGGMLELGERMAEGVRREVKEETGLEIEPLEVIGVLDRIERIGRRIRFHYVIVDYACRVRRGTLQPSSDVLGARWVKRSDLARFHLTPTAKEVIHQAFDFFKVRKPS
jgi:8-oxo-dGTP diphosphatase